MKVILRRIETVSAIFFLSLSLRPFWIGVRLSRHLNYLHLWISGVKWETRKRQMYSQHKVSLRPNKADGMTFIRRVLFFNSQAQTPVFICDIEFTLNLFPNESCLPLPLCSLLKFQSLHLKFWERWCITCFHSERRGHNFRFQMSDAGIISFIKYSWKKV